MTGFMPKELYFSLGPEINISSLNILIKQTWKEVIVIIDRHKNSINGALSMPPGQAARKVRGPWI